MKTTFAVLAALLFLGLVACGPTYVQPVAVQQPAYQYDPGYDPNAFAYDPYQPVIVVGGVRGYYGVNHVFFPLVSIGGVDGYYDSGHRFHTSVTNRTTVINNYQTEIRNHPAPASRTAPAGLGSQRTPAQAASAPVTPNGKPAYGVGPGTATVGASTRNAPQAAPVPSNAKPNFGAGPGASSVGASTRAAAPPPPPVRTAAPASVSRPSSPSGMGRGRR